MLFQLNALMKRSRRLAGCLVVGLGMFVVSCTTVEPLTGRQQFILTSPKMEMQMGLDAWRGIKKEEKSSSNQAYIAAVRRVGTNISRVVNQSGFDWEFETFASEQANAFCLPGGKVAVYDGLFEHIDNDAELAAVIGHEIAHAVARHGGERMTQAMMVQLGGVALAKALENEAAVSRERWLLAYTGVTSLGYVLPYSRTHEYAADELGLIYMARAGYDPEAALAFWKKFASDGKTPAVLEFLSTHPVGERRIARLRSLMPKAFAEYGAASVKRGLGQNILKP